MRSSSYDIILLSETWFGQDDRFIFRNFDVIKKGRVNRHGGSAAILIKNNIKYSTYNIAYTANDKFEVCAITIRFRSKSLTIISLYKPPNVSISRAEWVRFFSQFPNDILVGGDFNTHHPRWDDELTCAEGIKLVEAMDSVGLHCLNRGGQTRFATAYSRNSSIDLILTNNVSALTAHWKIMQESWGSDHLPIRIEIVGSVANRLRFNTPHKVYSLKTDWVLVRESLQECIPQCEELVACVDVDIQTKYSSFMALVEDCVKLHTPSRAKNDKGEPFQCKVSPWWNEECERLESERQLFLSLNVFHLMITL